jgi:hypothetical protein
MVATEEVKKNSFERKFGNLNDLRIVLYDLAIQENNTDALHALEYAQEQGRAVAHIIEKLTLADELAVIEYRDALRPAFKSLEAFLKIASDLLSKRERQG